MSNSRNSNRSRSTSERSFDLGLYNEKLSPIGLKIHSAKQDSSCIERLCQTVKENPCRRSQQTELFDLDDWHTKPWTLMHKANIERAYQGGDYYVLEKDDRVVAGAGFYQYHETVDKLGNKPFSILMSRFYTVPSSRMQWLGSYLLTAQLQAMRTFQGMLTFNEINSALYGKIARLDPNQPEPIWWPPVWRHFSALGNLYINSTPQWCVITDKQQHNLI